jgi:hypothetical protein
MYNHFFFLHNYILQLVEIENFRSGNQTGTYDEKGDADFHK